MNFPQSASLTITNHCNLRCQMCGQWSQQGYVRTNKDSLKNELTLTDWKGVVDELAVHGVPSVLLRGGEVFMFPGIVELLDYIHDKGMFISIDTNGTMLEQFAADIVRIGKMHLTVSVDGPEPVHDAVRGIPGAFQKLKAGSPFSSQFPIYRIDTIFCEVFIGFGKMMTSNGCLNRVQFVLFPCQLYKYVIRFI